MLDDLLKGQDQQKRRIILDAAEKLAGKYPDDTTVISVKLEAILARDRVITRPDGTRKTVHARVSPGYLKDVLPDRYKRAYRKAPRTADDTPANAMEEALALLADAFKNAAIVSNNMLRDMQELRNSDDPESQGLYGELQEEFGRICTHEALKKHYEYFKKQMSDIEHSGDFVRMVKECYTTVMSMKKLQDHRLKFNTLMKMNLKLLFFEYSLDNLATILTDSKQAAKWLGKIKREDNPLLKLIHCPKCGFDFQRYMEKAALNEQCGLPMPDHADFCTE